MRLVWHKSTEAQIHVVNLVRGIIFVASHTVMPTTSASITFDRIWLKRCSKKNENTQTISIKCALQYTKYMPQIVLQFLCYVFLAICTRMSQVVWEMYKSHEMMSHIHSTEHAALMFNVRTKWVQRWNGNCLTEISLVIPHVFSLFRFGTQSHFVCVQIAVFFQCIRCDSRFGCVQNIFKLFANMIDTNTKRKIAIFDQNTPSEWKIKFSLISSKWQWLN